MIKTGILRSLAISVKNVFSASKAVSSYHNEKTEERTIIYYRNNRAKSAISCVPTLPTPMCYEIGEDGYINIA